MIGDKIRRLKMTNRDTKYIDYRPWGHYKIIADYPGYKVKILSVNPGQKLSLQYHDHRKEVWTVLAGTAKIKLDGIEKTLLEQQTLNIENRTSSSFRKPK